MELPVKERLVGAAILVGLIVVLVPELLSGPKDSETVGGTADTGAVRTYTIDLTAPKEPAQTPQAVAEPEPIPVPAPIQSQPQPAREPPPTAAKVEPELEKTPPPAKEVVPPAEKSKPVQAEPKPAPAAAGWAVQLGSFASADNAKKLATELKTKGYQAFVSSTGAGTKARHRVRVGPVSSREEADKLAQKLKRDGRQVAVVAHP